MDLEKILQSPRVNVEELALPPNMPRMGNRFTRWLGARFLRLMGWKFRGEISNHKQIVIAGAPHTSNWDFVVAMFLVMALGVKFSYLMKKEAFIWPFKGLFMSLGGIPIDRSKGSEVISQVQQWYEKNSHCWVAITPEGTRSKVERYKTGFLRIAQSLDIPLMLVSWDYPSKTFYFIDGPELSGDIDADAADIKRFFEKNFTGRNPENQ
ncbi:1-acyl-sn-glycerol-3-phosphate acyltransferase [Sessilibacter corallicola]|uniref:Lysophosphatidylcholine acyltransferase n=1 Tax=Sessilibacter corallicola TaxID=2904075 RepID=A0ABQ0AC54_9GAMM